MKHASTIATAQLHQQQVVNIRFLKMFAEDVDELLYSRAYIYWSNQLGELSVVTLQILKLYGYKVRCSKFGEVTEYMITW